MKPPEPRGNRLLGLLEANGCAAFPAFTPVELRAHDVLQQAGAPGLYAYFPVTAVVSLVATMEGGDSAEVAVVGREGMVGLAAVLGRMDGPATPVVQIEGTALRTTTAELKAARAACPTFRTTLDHYTQARLIQVAQTAACNRLHPVDARLARWLLGIHDRIDGDRFRLSHESMAQVLGVYRPTVTTALQRLKDEGVIGHEGRTLVIADRAAAEALACECYGVVRAEFERLLQPQAREEGEGPPAPARERGLVERAAVERREVDRVSADRVAIREIAGRLLLAGIHEQELREEADRAAREGDRLLSTAAHELQTSLTGILESCGRLTRHNGNPAVGTIEKQARAGLQIVQDLLAERRGPDGSG